MLGFQQREWLWEDRKPAERHSADGIGLTWSTKSFELQDQDAGGQTAGRTHQCQVAGSAQACARGLPCWIPEARGTWKHRQVVGVAKGRGWGGWGETQEARGGQESAPWGAGSSREGHLGGPGRSEARTRLERIGHEVAL